MLDEDQSDCDQQAIFFGVLWRSVRVVTPKDGWSKPSALRSRGLDVSGVKPKPPERILIHVALVCFRLLPRVCVGPMEVFFPFPLFLWIQSHSYHLFKLWIWSAATSLPCELLKKKQCLLVSPHQRLNLQFKQGMTFPFLVVSFD